VFNEGEIPKELTTAFAATIRALQGVVESYLKDLAELTDFRPVPKGVRVRLVEDDWTLNAYAEKQDGGYVIGIHAGIIPHLLRPVTAALSLGCISEVRDRNELARWLLNAAIDFLIFHELGHIALAHLDYFEQARRSELSGENAAGDDVNDQVAIELMADEFAVAAVANRRLSGRYDDRSDIPEFSDAVVYDHALLFAIGLLFLVMTPREALTTFAATTHPHPEFRLGVVFALLYEGRSAPDPDVSRKVIADLAKMPSILGIPAESYVGTYWYNDPSRQVDMNAFNRLRMMFEQYTIAVKRMRPKLDLFRENLARHKV
jgi:hypothetical protein